MTELTPLTDALLAENHNLTVITPEFEAYVKENLGDDHLFVIAYSKDGKTKVFLPASTTHIDPELNGTLSLQLEKSGVSVVNVLSNIQSGIVQCPIVNGIPRCPC